MNIINNSQVLGSLNKDLVLNTLGKVYIRSGDRYYELDFQKNTSSTDDVEIKEFVQDNRSHHGSLPAEDTHPSAARK